MNRSRAAKIRHLAGPLSLSLLLITVETACSFAGQSRSVVATEALDTWPQWRGPEGNGISRATNLPTNWGPDKNIVWKTPMPSWSGGTPVIWEDRIFVTSASKAAPKADPAAPAGQQRQSYGRQRDPGGPSLLLI